MKPVQETVDATVASVASKVTGTGSAVTVVSWMTSSNLGLWAGILIGVSGLLINWYFKLRSDRRAQEAHKAFMMNMSKKQILIGPDDSKIED